MTLSSISFSAFGQAEFWIGVGVLAGIYGIFVLGLQLNVGYTGISNFGAAAFMAVGAYTMGILVVKTGLSFWLAFPLAVLAASLASPSIAATFVPYSDPADQGRQAWPGNLGLSFDVLSPISVTALGVFNASGNGIIIVASVAANRRSRPGHRIRAKA